MERRIHCTFDVDEKLLVAFKWRITGPDLIYVILHKMSGTLKQF